MTKRPQWLLAGKAGPNEVPLTPEQRQRYAQMQVEAQRRLQDGQQKLLLTQKAMQVLSQNGQLVRTHSVLAGPVWGMSACLRHPCRYRRTICCGWRSWT